MLREVSDSFALAELQSEPVFTGVREPSPGVARVPEPGVAAEQIRLDKAPEPKVAAAGSTRFAVPPDQPEFEQVTRAISDIKDMVPISVERTPRLPRRYSGARPRRLRGCYASARPRRADRRRA